jgi:FMN phosphatase YigB (HAD superfamily)
VSVDWVFFDMGGVLVDDEPAMLLVYRRLYERCNDAGIPMTPEELFALREELIAMGDGIHWHTVGKTLLGADSWRLLQGDLINELRSSYPDFNIPYPGIGDVIDEVGVNYHLGLAANQLSECRRVLELQGWIKHFKVLGISEEVGLRKPQPEFFRWLLNEAGVEPERCIMVGDRIDNDIRPAKALGFKTVWFKIEPDFEALAAGDDFARAYAASRKRAGLKHIPPKDESEVPDFSADTPGDVIMGIRELSGE